MDNKKKEELGDFSRNGKVYCQQVPKTLDHDFKSSPKGKLVPGGLYDMKLNEGYVSLGTNHETAIFLADNLIWWWENFGIHRFLMLHIY